MNRRKILYVALPILVIVCAFALETIVDSGLDIALGAMAQYYIGMIVAFVPLASIVSSFTICKDKPLMIMAMLNVSALLVIVEYYLNFGNEGSGNLLWLLPMVGIAYLMRYKAIVNPGEQKEENT